MTVSFFPFKESPSQQPSDASSFKTESEAMRERINTIDARKAEENSQNEALEAKREASLEAKRAARRREAVAATRAAVDVARAAAAAHAESTPAKAALSELPEAHDECV